MKGLCTRTKLPMQALKICAFTNMCIRHRFVYALSTHTYEGVGGCVAASVFRCTLTIAHVEGLGIGCALRRLIPNLPRQSQGQASQNGFKCV
jgi:hypothetical protein